MSDPMHICSTGLPRTTSRAPARRSVRRASAWGARTHHQVAASVIVGVAVVVAVAVLAPSGVRELTDRRSQTPAVSPSVEPTVGVKPQQLLGSSGAGRVAAVRRRSPGP